MMWGRGLWVIGVRLPASFAFFLLRIVACTLALLMSRRTVTFHLNLFHLSCSYLV